MAGACRGCFDTRRGERFDRIRALPRPDQLDRVPCLGQAVRQYGDGQGDTVDLGRIGFADDADEHARTP